jgi:hypothetical protein
VPGSVTALPPLNTKSTPPQPVLLWLIAADRQRRQARRPE